MSAVTVILIIGIKESARFNSVIVVIELAVVLMFIATAASFVKPANWAPFTPPNEATTSYGCGRSCRSEPLQKPLLIALAHMPLQK